MKESAKRSTDFYLVLCAVCDCIEPLVYSSLIELTDYDDDAFGNESKV